MTLPITALVFAMVAWINTTGVMPPTYPDNPVQLRYGTPADLVVDMQRCYRKAGVQAPSFEQMYQKVTTLYGFYCHDRVAINKSLVNLKTPQGQMVLAHELAHWLQDYNGTLEDDKCHAEGERDAYIIGWLWQDAMGLPRWPDEFSVAMKTMCPQKTEPAEEESHAPHW